MPVGYWNPPVATLVLPQIFIGSSHAGNLNPAFMEYFRISPKAISRK
jgi:hypothetical protein